MSGKIRIIISENSPDNYGEDNEFYGLTPEEINENKKREIQGKVKISPQGCGMNLNWNQMEDCSEKVIKILKKDLNIDKEDYYNGFLLISEGPEEEP